MPKHIRGSNCDKRTATEEKSAMKKAAFLLTALPVPALFSGIATAMPLPVTTDSGSAAVK
jgi:hypothetical protein